MKNPDAPRALPSVLGLSLQGSADWGTRSAAVRRAWDLGIRVLDLSVVIDPLGTLERLRLRFPDIVREAFVILSPLGDESAGSAIPRSRVALEADERDGVLPFAAAAQRALGGVPVDFFSIPWTRREEVSGGRAVEEVHQLMREHRLLGWGPDVGEDFRAQDVKDPLSRGAAAVLVQANLLRPHSLSEYGSLPSSLALPLVVRDPFGQGRLSGELIAQRTAAALALQGPTPVTELERTFRPVLRLRFLTEGRRRTLAQAAVQFLLQSSGVACVLLPEAGPERLSEWVSSRDRPPLTSSEMERIRSGAVEPPQAADRPPDGSVA